MAGFGFLGYWADVWEVRSTELIEERKEVLRRNRQKAVEAEERLVDMAGRA